MLVGDKLLLFFLLKISLLLCDFQVVFPLFIDFFQVTVAVIFFKPVEEAIPLLSFFHHFY